MTKKMQLMITKISASFAETFPDGISRIWVRGFLASIFLSRNLLNAIAELRAKIMQSKTWTSSNQLNGFGVLITPKKKPISAKGKAKTEWANSTSEKYFFIYFTVLLWA